MSSPINNTVDLGKIGVLGALSASQGWSAPARGIFPYEEVEAAFLEYVRRANIDDWNLYSDMFTEECVYIDHHFGTFRSPAEIKAWMNPLMATQPEMRFIPGWYVIKDDMVINYNWNRWPNPDGSAEPYGDYGRCAPVSAYQYQYPCVTMNRYAGDGLFWFEEDIYSPSAYLEIRAAWQREMDRLGRPYAK
jgi:hypothetical protein